MLSSEKKLEIAELAEFIALEYPGDACVNLEHIARKKGITFRYNDYGECFDGLLEHKGGHFHIFCNLSQSSDRTSPRVRFTFAHELGHYFIDEHRRALESGRIPKHASIVNYRSKNPVEREADYFASKLLMPDVRFLPLVRKGSPGFSTIMAIAKKFQVSITSASVRYVDSNFIPCALIKWGGEKVEWRWIAPGLRENGFKTTIGEQNLLAKDCPTAMALRGESTECEYFEAGTTLSVWSPYIGENSYKNEIFIEQAISLGRYGVLTLLHSNS